MFFFYPEKLISEFALFSLFDYTFWKNEGHAVEQTTNFSDYELNTTGVKRKNYQFTEYFIPSYLTLKAVSRPIWSSG